jgi:stage II sporulation protein M
MFNFKYLQDEIHKKYSFCFNYLKDSKKFIWFSIGIFLFFSLVGFFVPLPGDIQNEIIEYFKKLVLETQGFNFWQMFDFLFKNNMVATFVGLFSGIFFGIFSFFNLIVNGFVLGFASSLSVLEDGLFSLWRLFPHGIFELPAVFISLALGMKLGSFIFLKNSLEKFKEFFLASINVYLFIVLPLLLIAAILESILIVFS